jgi:subtilisin family serine protease
MVKKSRIYTMVMLLLLGVGVAFGQLSDSMIRQKLHPTFQAVVTSNGQSVLSKLGAGPTSPAVTVTNGKVLFDAIVTTTNPDAIRAKGIHVNSAFGKYATAQVTREDILNLVQLAEVQYLDPGSTTYPTLEVSLPETRANLLHGGFLNGTPYKGKGVIVVIYDTGIDWRHFDFRDPVDTTKSRILSIWDQTLTKVTGESWPSTASYGVEYTKQQIEDEIDGTPTGFVREKDVNGHGTHVAGIATGNGNSYFKKYVGVAPEADIIVVKGGDGSFTDARIIDGLNYAGIKAAQLGKPVVVNLSLGGQYGPHNGNSAYEAMINTFVSVPGKVVTVSAGNDGDKTIHSSGSVSPGTTTSISINVPAYTPKAGTGNDKFQLDIWFTSQLGVTAEVVSPNNVRLQIGANNSGTAGSESDGTIDLYNFPSSVTEQSTLINLVVSDKSTNIPRVGTWTVNLTGATSPSSFDAWLSSSDLGGQAVSIVNGNSQKTVGMPGTAEGAITVAAYVTKNFWASANGKNWQYGGSVVVGARSLFSSIGPTGDGRQKPDIAAPGQGIASSLSTTMTTFDTTFVLPGFKDQLMAGTSQAAPHIAGVVALLLQGVPTLTAPQIKSYLMTTARTDGSTGSTPNTMWGYGKVDAFKAMEKALGTSGGALAILNYASSSRFFTLLPSSNQKFAMRFTPTITGKIASVSVAVNGGTSGVKGTGSLKISAAENIPGSVAGIPGAQLGSSVPMPFPALIAGAWNNIDMSSANVTVSNGVDFQIIMEVVGTVGDTLQVLLDDGTTSPTNRASSYRTGLNGLQWYNRADPNYGGGKAASFENILISATIASISVGVEQQSSIVPNTFELYENFPNPFNPSTSIRYSVPVQSRIHLRIFDLIGREVASLVDELQARGNYAVHWHGTDNTGVPLPSGVYFYRLESAGQHLTKKMLLIK